MARCSGFGHVSFILESSQPLLLRILLCFSFPGILIMHLSKVQMFSHSFQYSVLVLLLLLLLLSFILFFSVGKVAINISSSFLISYSALSTKGILHFFFFLVLKLLVFPLDPFFSVYVSLLILPICFCMVCTFSIRDCNILTRVVFKAWSDDLK